MSRVGRMPISLPQGLDFSATAEQIKVKGPLGTLVRPANPLVIINNTAGKLEFLPANDSTAADAMSGTMRALVANMVGGVSKGFEKRLSLVGVGFNTNFLGSMLLNPKIKPIIIRIKIHSFYTLYNFHQNKILTQQTQIHLHQTTQGHSALNAELPAMP